MLDPLPHLDRFKLPHDLPMACPTCKKGFKAVHGVPFLSYWVVRDEQGEKERRSGHPLFCSTTCVLNFVDDTEVGHG